MRYIAILLLLTTTLSAQTKWRQIERSLVKWNVPAAYDSIPGQSGYAGKWISMAALLDSINYTVGDLNGTGEADQVTYWKTTDSLTGSNNLKWLTNNYLNVIGRMGLQATSTAGNFNAFINGGNTTVTGNSNVAIGSNQTLSSVTSGSNNVVLGRLSGNKITTGNNNMLIGYLSGAELTTAERNTFVGSESGYLNTGNDNTLIGNAAGRNGTNYSNSTYIGNFSGYSATNSNNVSIGYYSSFSNTNTGQSNVVIGNSASQNGGGDKSVKIGTSSGYANTGSNNVFIGQESGYSSSAKGGNIFIGYQSGRNEDIDNSLIIANSSSTSNGIYGDFDTSKFGINVTPSSITRTFDINGELRVRDLTTDTPTLLIGADSDGDVASVSVGNGLTLSSSTLKADTSVLATQYDLAVIDGGGPDSTIVAAGWGVDVVESPANTFTVTVDSSEVATAYDLTLKQDKLVSGTNIKTVNSNSLLGTGNVSVGTVTSVATSFPITGGTITGSGTIGLNYDTETMTIVSASIAAKNTTAVWNANKLQGTNISSSVPSTNQVLTYNGSAWAPATPSAGTTNLTFTGSASPFTLNSDTGTDVTIAAGTGIELTRSSNQLTIASTLTAPQTWGDFTTNIQSWGSTGSFGSGKDVGIGGQPSRDFDVIGDSRLRGAIYNSGNSAGTSGQVLTSQGSSAWIWATPADGSATNEAQTLSLGSNGVISLSNVSGSGGGTATIPQATYGYLYNTGNLSSLTLNSNTPAQLTFSSGQGNNTTVSTANESITILSAGTYKIEYNGSYQVQDPEVQRVYFNIYKNGSDIGYTGECRTKNNDDTINNMTNFSRSFIVDLLVNDEIELYYENVAGSNTTFSVFNLNLSVQRIN